MKALEVLLLSKAALLKHVAVERAIHEDVIRTSMDVMGYWNRSNSSRSHWRSAVLPQASGTVNNTPVGVCVLCSQILLKRVQLKELYDMKDFIVSNLEQFSIDQLLLLLYTLEKHVRDYSTWFRINNDTLTVLLMSCHLHLLQRIGSMTSEQLRSTLMVTSSICKRYPVYGLAHIPLQREIMGRLLALSDGLSHSLASSSRGKKFKPEEGEITKLPTKLQRIYREIYPYFEAINGILAIGRGQVCNLIVAAMLVQQQHSVTNPFPLEPFNELCLRLKRLILEPALFSLESIMNLVILLQRNSSISPEAVMLEIDVIRALVTKQKELAIDAFIVVPDETNAPVFPSDVEQCATKLLSSTLECPKLGCIVAYLKAIRDANLINKHMIILSVPYIVNNLRDDCESNLESMLALISPMLTVGLTGFPFWVVYLSILERTISSVRKKDMDNIVSLCNILGEWLEIICQHISGDSGTPVEGTMNEHDITSKCDGAEREHLCSIKDNRWLGYIDDLSLFHVYNINELEESPTLATLLDKKFYIDIRSKGFVNCIIDVLQGLEAAVEHAINSLKEGYQEGDMPMDTGIPHCHYDKPEDKQRENVYRIDPLYLERSNALKASHRSVTLQIDIFKRLLTEAT